MIPMEILPIVNPIFELIVVGICQLNHDNAILRHVKNASWGKKYSEKDEVYQDFIEKGEIVNKVDLN